MSGYVEVYKGSVSRQTKQQPQAPNSGDEEYLVVNGVGIKPGDTFLFYHSDLDTASSSCLNALESLKVLKSASSSKNRYSMRDAAAGGNGGVFGGLIFSCHFRGESYFESFPFYSNFPGAPLAGVVCNKEIGRDSTGSSMWQLQAQNQAHLTLLLPPPSDSPCIQPKPAKHLTLTIFFLPIASE